MRRIPTPKIFCELKKIGVVLKYSFFDSAGPTRSSRLLAIDAHLADANEPCEWHLPKENAEALELLAERKLDRSQFLGQWCNPSDLSLIQRGSGHVQGVGEVENLRYDDARIKRIRSWTSSIPDSHDAGEYAFAFSQPPYSLFGGRAKAQRLFRESTGVILPPSEKIYIYDWSGADLSEVDSYFEAGMDWWGIYLFTIFQPSIGRMIVISGSTTD